MHYLHPAFAALPLLVAVLSVRLSLRWRHEAAAPAHLATIDGLRGYLAFFVFLHHAAIWYDYLQSHVWQAPASHFYNQLGQSSVALFFMITSFLFFGKLIDRNKAPFSWPGFFIGRVCRLFPLYAAVLAVTFYLVAIASTGTLVTSRRELAASVTSWLLFTIPGAPRINLVDAGLMLANVTWTLPYEWCFYLVLPLIAVATGRQAPWPALALACAGLAIFWSTGLRLPVAMAFCGGLIAALLVRYSRFVAWSTTPYASALVLLCAAAATRFDTAFDIKPVIMLSIAFCLIAGGADMFGVLRTATSRRLGEFAYSMYLVHGILLFAAFNFCMSPDIVRNMPGWSYWLTITLLVPVFLGISSLTFRFVELPGMRFGQKMRHIRIRLFPKARIGNIDT